MSEHEKDPQLNAVLDSLLANYSAAEPRPGLETRIRARLKARAARRQRTWILVFAASAAAMVLAVLVVKMNAERQSVPEHVIANTPSRDVAPVRTEMVPPAPRRAARQIPDDRRVAARRNTTNQILLQIASIKSGTGNLVFEHEKSYLAPVNPQEPEPVQETVPEREASAGNISIQSLGVQPIAIKELAPVKDMD